MRKFDYSFLSKEAIPSHIASLLFAIGKNHNASETLKKYYPSLVDKLIKIAKIQSVKASNEIEGIVTTDKRIISIINHETEPLNHNEKEITGYRDVLEKIHNDHNAMDASTRDILLMHKMLLEHTGNNERGQFKKSNNIIAERHRDGSTHVRFVPIDAKDTSGAMNQLELALKLARQNSDINPLLLIPCYILDFLCIHPFIDGNGRMSRLLTTLLLYNSNYDIGKYISLEYIINKNKSGYYQKLYDSSIGWIENKNSYWPFVENFLLTVLSAYNELSSRYEILKEKKLSKAERIRETIKSSLGKITKEDIHNFWPDISCNTIELELSRLLNEGLIKKVGSTKGASYFWCASK